MSSMEEQLRYPIGKFVPQESYSAEQVKAKAMQSGYTQVTKLKADDGQWEGEGIKNGARMEFKADPKTGAITSEKPDDDDD